MNELRIGGGVELICRFGVAADDAAAKVTAFLLDAGIEADRCTVYERSISGLQALSETVSRSGKPHFRAEVGPVVADMGGVRNYDHTLIALESDEEDKKH